ncbi:MAG TPA: hypothetical protein VEH47_05785 [Candidatus Acidoferrales bacterium]|nr:hypothetical protein [Candidatus Acidoferrales bacterium]
MPTNVEKLAAELNALTEYDPMALECTAATISQVPGEHRIYLQSFMENAVFHIDFDKVLPYDPSGAPGTTSDVFAGAHISLHVTPGDGMDKAACEKFAPGYLHMVRFSLHRAAKARRISSKILAGMFTKSEIQKAAKEWKARVKEHKAKQAEFLDSLDPATRRGILALRKDIRAKRKAEGKK